MPYPETHPDARRLYAYLDGALSPGEHTAVELHVVDCGLCAAKLAEAEALCATIGSLPEWHPSRNFAPGVVAAITPRAIVLPDLRRAVGAQIATAIAIGILAAPLVMQAIVQPLLTQLALLGGQADVWVSDLSRLVSEWRGQHLNALLHAVQNWSVVVTDRVRLEAWTRVTGWLWILLPLVIVWLAANTALLRSGDGDIGPSLG